MPKFLQVAREPSFAAADVNRPPPRPKHDLKELIAVEAPVTIMPSRARPFNPLSGMSFPTFMKVHALDPRCRRTWRNVYAGALCDACSKCTGLKDTECVLLLLVAQGADPGPRSPSPLLRPYRRCVRRFSNYSRCEALGRRRKGAGREMLGGKRDDGAHFHLLPGRLARRSFRCRLIPV